MRIRMKRGSPSAPETSVGGWDQPSHDEPPHLASRRPASGSTAFQQSVTLPSAPLRAPPATISVFSRYCALSRPLLYNGPPFVQGAGARGAA